MTEAKATMIESTASTPELVFQDVLRLARGAVIDEANFKKWCEVVAAGDGIDHYTFASKMWPVLRRRFRELPWLHPAERGKRPRVGGAQVRVRIIHGDPHNVRRRGEVVLNDAANENLCHETPRWPQIS